MSTELGASLTDTIFLIRLAEKITGNPFMFKWFHWDQPLTELTSSDTCTCIICGERFHYLSQEGSHAAEHVRKLGAWA